MFDWLTFKEVSSENWFFFYVKLNLLVYCLSARFFLCLLFKGLNIELFSNENLYQQQLIWTSRKCVISSLLNSDRYIKYNNIKYISIPVIFRCGIKSNLQVWTFQSHDLCECFLYRTFLSSKESNNRHFALYFRFHFLTVDDMASDNILTSIIIPIDIFVARHGLRIENIETVSLFPYPVPLTWRRRWRRRRQQYRR